MPDDLPFTDSDEGRKSVRGSDEPAKVSRKPGWVAVEPEHILGQLTKRGKVIARAAPDGHCLGEPHGHSLFHAGDRALEIAGSPASEASAKKCSVLLALDAEPSAAAVGGPR